MLKRLCLIAGLSLGLLACSERVETTPSGTSVENLPEHPGAALVKAKCMACHKPGLNGAPIIGNTKMWGPRLEQGEQVLVEHAIGGFGLMPPRGGSSLSDEEITLAVSYMLSQLPSQ